MKSFDTVARCRIRPGIVDEIPYLFIVCSSIFLKINIKSRAYLIP